MNFLQHIKSKCLIVDPENQSSGMLIDCLKKHGVIVTERCRNLQDALKKLETENFSWIITQSFQSEPVNILQFLSVIVRQPELRTTFVSLFYKQTEIPLVLASMELGLISCFPAIESQTQLEDNFGIFWKKEAFYRGDNCSIAADYLSGILVQQKFESHVTALRQKLVEHFPGNLEHLLKLAESKAATGDIVHAASTLTQIKLIAPSLQSRVEEIRSTYMPDVHLIETGQKATTNILGIHRAVIVDPDQAILNSVAETLDSLGAKGVEIFTSPEDALVYLKDRPDLDILIHEWKMPKISGPLFVQNVRQLGLEKTPIILCSSQVQDRDQHLTREMGIATVVPKPFKKKLLLESIIWTMKQEYRPTEIRIIERKIQGFLSRNNLARAKECIAKIKIEKKLTESCFGYFEAEILFFEQKFEASKAQAMMSLRKGFVSVRLYHLMGKILMKLGDFENAIKFLEKAQELSPQHILRLCLLADAQTELGKLKSSRATLDHARELDPQNKALLHSEVSFSLKSNDLKKAEKIFQSLEFFDEIVSYLNSRAVALSKAGKHIEAIETYQKALQSLPPKAGSAIGSLYYNLSLAHIRAQDFDSAVKTLKQAEKMSEDKLHKKVLSLRQRLQKALGRGESFSLNSGEQNPEKESSSYASSPTLELLAQSELEPGDYCLYKIFAESPLSKELKLPRQIPQFQLKVNIAREEGLELEKAKKKAS